jgi:pimeloyl-ACP methyl ester carboxylesterase
MHATSTPTLDRTMELVDGRTLAFSEWGDLDGKPVVLLHGMPSSRLMCPDLDATLAAGVRLITIDRPGYGRSDPRTGRTMLNWVDDFVELADHLGLPPSPVLGWSGGGPYALACGYRLPDRVSAIGLAGSPGLTGEVPGALEDFSREGRALVEMLQTDRAAGVEGITRLCQTYGGDGLYLPLKFRAHRGPDRSAQTRFILSSGDADDRLLARPGMLDAIQAWLGEGARQGSTGFVQDWIDRADRDGFSVADIRQDVHIWIGEADRQVPRYHADFMAATIPRSKLTSYPREGHLFPFVHWGEMLEELIA